jgi:hypothetical protein
MEENEKRPDFSILLKTTDPMSLLMQQMFDLKVEVGVLEILVMDLLAVNGKRREEIAERSQEVRHDLALRFAFDLQDTHDEKSQQSDS